MDNISRLMLNLNESSNIRESLPIKYEKLVNKYEKNVELKPQSLYYQELLQNAKILLKISKKFKLDAKIFRGLSAIIALSNLPVGTKVSIKSTTINGNFELKSWASSGYSSGSVWKNDRVDFSFGYSEATVASTLGLVRGGLYTDDKSVIVRVLSSK